MNLLGKVRVNAASHQVSCSLSSLDCSLSPQHWCQPGAAVPFEGSTGAGATSKLTHMVDGRVQFFEGFVIPFWTQFLVDCWQTTLSFFHVSLSIGQFTAGLLASLK